MKLKNALLIQPLSAAKMTTGLSPDRVLSRYFDDLSRWVVEPTNDVAFIFTTGLYQNNDNPNPRAQRMSLLQREGEWKNRFEKLITRNSEKTINGFPLMRQGFQLAGWDENITGEWNEFSENLGRLKTAYKRDSTFRNMIESEIKEMGREPTEANVAFILEEISVTALWLKGNINIPKGLREHDRIDALHIVYPSSMPKFMAEGLQEIFKGKRHVLPLVWIDTSDEKSSVPSTFRFGKDAPAMSRI